MIINRMILMMVPSGFLDIWASIEVKRFIDGPSRYKSNGGFVQIRHVLAQALPRPYIFFQLHNF